MKTHLKPADLETPCDMYNLHGGANLVNLCPNKFVYQAWHSGVVVQWSPRTHLSRTVKLSRKLPQLSNNRVNDVEQISQLFIDLDHIFILWCTFQEMGF